MIEWYRIESEEHRDCEEWAKREDVEPMLEEYWRMKSKLAAIRRLSLHQDELDQEYRKRRRGDD